MRLALSLSLERPLPGISRLFLARIVKTTCVMALSKVFVAGRLITLEVAAVSEEEIQRLNRLYRNENRPTDILSFGNVSSPRGFSRVQSMSIDLGQLILSPDYIRRSAMEDGVSWERELVFVVSHGVLHLLGFDHSEKMFALQNRVTDSLTGAPANKK